MSKPVYGNLKPKQKKEHLKLLENAVLTARHNLASWETSLRILKEEMK